jgi:hypothetical protein
VGAQGGFTLSTNQLSFSGQCTLTAQPFIITNTSGVNLVWHASASLSSTNVTPSGSTLLPGQAQSVSVLPEGWVGSNYSSLIRVDANGASQSVGVSAALSGTPAPASLPPDIDFGNVALGSSKTALISPFDFDSGAIQVATISDQPASDMSIPESTPANHPEGFGWLVTFRPQAVGPKEHTITFTDFAQSVCPPNSIKARGIGVTLSP